MGLDRVRAGLTKRAAIGRWTAALVVASLVTAAAIQVVGEIGARDTRDRVREAQLALLESEAKTAAADLADAIDSVRGLLQATGAARIGLDQADLLKAVETKDHDRLLGHLLALHRAMPVWVTYFVAAGGTPGANPASPRGFEPIAVTSTEPGFGEGIRTQVRGSPREVPFTPAADVRGNEVPGPERTKPWLLFAPGSQVVGLGVPVLGPDGRSHGTLLADISTTELFRLSSGSTTDSVMYVVDANGALVERISQARVTRRRSGDDLSTSDLGRAILGGSKVRGDIALPLDEGSYLAASASTPVLLGAKPEFDLDIGWRFVVARPANAVYADVDATLSLLAAMRWGLSAVLVFGGLALGITIDAAGRRRGALAEALERQRATSTVLRVVSGSPEDAHPAAQAIVDEALRLCGADLAILWRRDGGHAVVEAVAGVDPEGHVRGYRRDLTTPVGRASVTAQAFKEGRTIHVADMFGEDARQIFGPAITPARWREYYRNNWRSALAVPVTHGDELLGLILLRRMAPGAFRREQIDLVESFASQASVAIRNVRLFNEIQDKSRELEAASRHKSEFLANMSHELRTPLNAIIGFSDVLGSGMTGELSAKQREYVGDISTSGRHLLDLVNEILDLSKVEAGRMELEPSTFAVAETVLSTFNFVRERAAKHGIELAAEVPSDLGTITADERKVRQVLLNLLSNAVKFTPDGGWIGVTARREDGEVTISVRDTGIGIAPEDQARVFDEFRQVGKASDRSREGTGLGLTLAKRFIELHGGRIWLESEVGKGTTFTFALPASLARSTTVTPSA